MKITIKGTNIELTESLKTYVEEKIGSLDKYLAGILLTKVELELTTKHHQKGKGLFRAEGNLRAPKHLFRAEANASDLYAAIDGLRDELKAELTRFKNKKIRIARRASEKR